MPPKKMLCLSNIIDVFESEIDEIIAKITLDFDRPQMLQKIATDFKNHCPVADYYLDSLFPKEIAKKSFPHWTPCQVAIRAIELLNPNQNSRVLDIGSGCGKFCIIAGLSSKGHFTGIEQRENLVSVAKVVKREFEIKNVTFIHGNITELDWSRYDCWYLFNPFYENVMKDESFWIDDSILIEESFFDTYVRLVEKNLKQARIGTRVVTYHGFGGVFPARYTNIVKEMITCSTYDRTGDLELWVKTS